MSDAVTDDRLTPVHVPGLTVTSPGVPGVVCAGDHPPAGIARVTIEPAENALAALFVNVKVNVLPVVPPNTRLGDTVIVPFPSAASVNVDCASDWLPYAVR